MGWEWLIPLITTGLGGLFGGGGDDESNTATTTAEQRVLQQQMLELIGQQRGYMSEQDPLRQAVLAMAMGMMPQRYQQSSGYRSSPTNVSGSGHGRTVEDDGSGQRTIPRGTPPVPGQRTIADLDPTLPTDTSHGRGYYDEAYRNTVNQYFRQ